MSSMSLLIMSLLLKSISSAFYHRIIDYFFFLFYVIFRFKRRSNIFYILPMQFHFQIIQSNELFIDRSFTLQIQININFLPCFEKILFVKSSFLEI